MDTFCGMANRALGKKLGSVHVPIKLCFEKYSTIQLLKLAEHSGAFDRKVVLINIVLNPILETLPKQSAINNKPAKKALKKKNVNKYSNYTFRSVTAESQETRQNGR
jgi:hypothetical protein